mgnify:CR=1 FL=1
MVYCVAPPDLASARVSMTDSPRRRHPALAAALSFLIPGLGQAYNGERALAMLLAVPVLGIVATILVIALVARVGVIARLLDARFLIGLIVRSLVLAVATEASHTIHPFAFPVLPRFYLVSPRQ